MGAKYTKGQAAATARYMQDKHVIKVVVTKSKALEYKTLAGMSGKSLSQFVIDCVEYYCGAIEKDNERLDGE